MAEPEERFEEVYDELRDELEELCHEKRYNDLRKRFLDMNPADIAWLFDDMPEDHFRFIFDNSGEMKGTCTMQSVEVNNTVAVAQAAKTIMDDPDREAVLKLVATGYLADKETGKAEIVLVDTQKDSIMSHWTEFKDLSKLNSVDAVRFNMVSEGADFPLSVCLDNMKMNVTLVVE